MDILKLGCRIFASICQKNSFTARMVFDKMGHIDDQAIKHNPCIFAGIVLRNLFHCQSLSLEQRHFLLVCVIRQVDLSLCPVTHCKLSSLLVDAPLGPRSKDSVHVDGKRHAIIALEFRMVQKMKISSFGLHPIMPTNGRNVCVELHIQEMKRMHSEKQRWQSSTRVIEKVLHRMHAEATPWSWVVGLVMQGVHVPVEEGSNVPIKKTFLPVPPRVHATMSTKEVNLSPIRNAPQQED
mmetsp:Transcript_54805/g.90749  ORF Transcript_54805/g.90749 Transcript_54805/m.90749 type:complete len:238 (+) Transcript_54805:161-874(+)